ncbi:MAG: oligopeptide/dipeptide ABC transporter ATP-binding protein [Anaerovoracaceae bacterium]
MSMSPLLEIKGLKKHFTINRGIVDAIMRKPPRVLKAVDGVSLEIYAGESLGIVGESGCGKSTLAKTLIRLYKPDGGSIHLDGRDISHISPKEMRDEARNIQMIFQDPYSSLNPRMSVRQTLSEALTFHNLCTPEEMEERILELMGLVGLYDYQADRMPSDFSGGQRQRIGIARALALEPKLIIADEPVSALDVSIQAQIINLLIDLRNKLGLTVIFISHDLRVVKYITNRVAVMYLGKIMELAETHELFETPRHPYTSILIQAAPSIEEEFTWNSELIHGELPSPMNPPSGCLFHPRCPYAKEICSQVEPGFVEISKGHFASCHFPLSPCSG